MLLKISIPIGNQPVDCIMSMTGVERLDNLINTIKLKTLECFNYIYKYLFESLTENIKS